MAINGGYNMIIEKIVVIFVQINLIILLGRRYIKRYAPENLVILPIASFCLGIYIPFAIFNVTIHMYIQMIWLILGILLPSIAVFLQYNNIIISRKILYNKIKINFSCKDYEKTKEYIEKLVMLEGRSAKYMHILGICYKNMMDFINARDCFSLAIELDERYYKSYYELGMILDETNKKEKAMEMYEKALKIKPDFYEASEALGICLTSQGLFKEAVEFYKKALKRHSNSYEMYYNIAMLEMELGNYEESEKAFVKASEIKPDLYTAYYNIGYLRFINNRPNEAIEAYQKATSSTVYGAKSYYKIAVIYASLREKEKSMAALEYAIELEPDYLKKAMNDSYFYSMRDLIIQYKQDMQELREREKEKKNYMKNRFNILKFVKKDKNEEEIREEEYEKIV